MARVINFYAGPAGLPLPALERAQRELLDFGGTGMSVMEISHRATDYEAVHNEAIALTRELLGVPDNYRVLLLQGGGNLQFAMLPLNLLHGGRVADYVVTGNWAKGAFKEARLVDSAAVRLAASTEAERFRRLPTRAELKLTPGAAYLHVTSNNTVEGSQWFDFPATDGVPLACDMSSDFLWRKFDIAPFGLIYAGAQKNLGPAGVTVVIIRDDVLAHCRTDLPSYLRYAVHAEKNSLFNTPPCFAVYMLRNVLEHNRSIGGLEAIERSNREKGRLLYACVDRHAGFYRGHIAEPAQRSFMNATFHLPSEDLDARFVAEAKNQGMVGLKGYRDVGGIRVSMYNAVTVAQVATLTAFMDDFVRRNG